MQTDPWAFGWTQALTLLGFAITIIIALGGFRTFNRWKREKIEERRLESAYDCLTLAYESKWVFGNIRSPLTMSYEYADMPKTPGETDDKRKRIGIFYAVFKRIENNKEYFERLWKAQPRAMSIFGPEVEDIFVLAHEARREIEISAMSLREQVEDADFGDKSNAEFYKQCRRDIWDHGGYEADKDKVGKKLNDFRTKTEKFFRPIVMGKDR